MRRLRSRWTVVALAPAFFLAGFGLVTALAGSDDAAPAAAGAGADGTGGNEAPAASAPGGSTATAVPTATGQTGAAAAGTTTTTSTTTSDGDGSGRGAPAPPPGTIEVDYGRWEGLFELSDMEIVPEFGIATVTGEFRYLGGGECSQLGVVELRGQFYSPSGQPIGKGLWESIWVTGDGAEVPQREPLYLEFYGAVSEAAESARIRFARVNCL
ncbi:MAG TPA: hypothetical protein VNO56_03705 [Gaiellaceae bacterium]|nr:hypothetical protein [Gaiellaceae bacterium]